MHKLSKKEGGVGSETYLAYKESLGADLGIGFQTGAGRS